MSSSRTESCGNRASESRVISERRITPTRQRGLFEVATDAVPGSINDAGIIREILADSIKKSGKSRAQIADIMSRLAGTKVTERRLNAYTAESKESFRFPLELMRAFCMATEDFTLLQIIAGMAGLRVVTKTEFDVLQLGHEYLTHKRAAENMALLEKRLAGGGEL